MAIAKTRLSSADPLLAHKTSRRDIYAAARAEFPMAGVDEVLLRNERGEICEGTITSVFATTETGQLLTPPLQSGLLDGVLRNSLLLEDRARTGVLFPEDLAGRTFHVGNSLRGLIAAALSDPYLESRPMLILDLTYLVPLAEAEPHMDNHMTWVAAGYEKGLFLASGRKNPRTGGVILSRGAREEVEAWCAEDPFVVHGIAEYRTTELLVTRTAAGLETLKS